MADYLITGVAGFIAARVAELLLEAGHSVTGFDNLNTAYDVCMKEQRLIRLQERPRFTFERLDISDRPALEKWRVSLEGSGKQADFTAVINLAARAGVRKSVENPWLYLETNVNGTLNMLELCRDLHIPKFILASTSSVYGADAPLPTPESANTDRPLNPYSASKKSAEVLSHAYHFLYGIDVTVLRYFTVYGPFGRPDMSMFRFVQWISEGRPLKLYGDGEQTRGFTYVDDIARGTIQALKPLGYEIINLGGHENISMNRLIQLMEELIGRKAIVEQLPSHPADMLANWAEVEKARCLLGWEPQVSLATGVSRMLEWYRAEHAWTSQVKTGE
jgi:UDP-glucuronate 4-epimerase